MPPIALFGQRQTSLPTPVVATIASALDQPMQHYNRTLANVIRSLVKKHASTSDLQTAAMLCCVFAKATLAAPSDEVVSNITMFDELDELNITSFYSIGCCQHEGGH